MYASHDSRSTSKGFMSDAQVLQAAADLVDTFLTTIEDLAPGQDILDNDHLPVERTTLESGFRLAIAAELQPARRHRLVAAGMLLAQFQPHVGRRIRFRPAHADVQPEHGETAFGQQLEILLDQVEIDRSRLGRLFDEAEAIAARRAARPAQRPFRDDGTYTWYGHAAAAASARH